MHSEGLNYLWFSRELDIRDGVPAFGLFSPNHSGDYLGIKRTDGTTLLLTWLAAGVEPLNLNSFADYRMQVFRLGEMGDLRPDEEAYRHVYDQLKTDPTWGYQLHPPLSY